MIGGVIGGLCINAVPGLGVVVMFLCLASDPCVLCFT